MSQATIRDPVNKKIQDSYYSKNVVRAAKGGGISFLGRLLEYSISLAFVFMMARMLGAEKYGLYRIMVTVVSISSVICLIGLDGGTKRFIAIAQKELKIEEIWGVIQIGIGIPTIVGFIVTMALLFGAEAIAIHIFHDPHLVSILRLGSLAIPFLILLHAMSSISIGFKKMEFVLYGKDLGFNLSKLFLSLLAIFLGFGLEGVTIAFAASAAIGLSIIVFYVNRHFSLTRPINSGHRKIKEIMSFSIPLSLSTFIAQFGRKFEVLILGIYGIAADVGIFAAILAISNVGAMGYTALRNISSPIIAELHSQNNLKDLEKYYQLITKWSLIFNLPFFLVIILLGENILILIGKEYTIGTVGLTILAIGTLFNAASGTCGTLINMTGYSKVNFYNSIIYLIVTIVLDFLLIPKYQVLGAAIAGALSIFVLNLIRTIQVFYLVNRILPYNRSFIKLFIASGMAFLTILWMREWLFINEPVLQLVVLSVVLAFIYFAMIFLLKLSPEDKLIVERIYNSIGKKKSKKKGSK